MEEQGKDKEVRTSTFNIFGTERQEGESFQEYQERRATLKRAIKELKKGRRI